MTTADAWSVHLVLEEWLDTRLGERPALLRPGLRLKRTWRGNALASAGEASALAEEIRADVDAILGAAHEPALPVTGGSFDAALEGL
jgi:hypothetical protein